MFKDKVSPDEKVKGSLAARILLVTAMLVILPLVLLSVALYYGEVQLKKKERHFALQVLLDRSVRSVSHTIEDCALLLETIDLLSLAGNLSQDTLSKLAVQRQVTTLLHLSKVGHRYLCDHSSDPSWVGRDFSYLVTDEGKQPYLLICQPQQSQCYFFCVSRESRGMWGMVFSTAYLVHRTALDESLVRPTNLSLLTPSGQVLFSTLPSFVSFIDRTKIEKGYDTFTWGKKKRIGLSRSIPHSNLIMLISMPAHISFVDFPGFFLKLWLFLACTALIGGGGALFLSFRLAMPMRHFCKTMQEVGEGNLSARCREDSMGFEVNVLGTIFNRMVESLIQHMKNVERERGDKEKLAHELMIGHEVQHSMLLQDLPIRPSLEIAVQYLSAKEVGGDFYEFLVKECPGGDQLLFAIADASGKGISACLYSLGVRSILRSCGRIYSDLSDIVRETNNLFCYDTGDSGIFVTAWIACFEESSRKLHYANCGHHPALLQKKSGEIVSLTTQGIALGVCRFEDLSIGSIQLEVGDTLLLFTDGVVEAHNSHMTMFGQNRLFHWLSGQLGNSSGGIADGLLEEIRHFSEGFAQYDDITITVLKVKK